MSNPLAAAAARRSAWRGDGVSASSSYQGAVSSRLTEDWVLATIKSADQEVRGDIRRLRARARELVRNNDTARRYIGLVEDNVVGHQGIRFQARVSDRDGDQDEEINTRIEEAWERWSKPDQCSVDGRWSWLDVQTQAMRGLPQDGETLIRIVTGFRGNDFGIALHLLDPDQLDETFNRERGRAPGGQMRNEVRMGVEIDRWGRPVAYHLWNRHPAEHGRPERTRDRVPASEIIHLYRPDRVNQTRGVTWFAPALFKLKMVAGYEEAELVASRMAAAKGGFFERTADAVTVDPNSDAADERIAIEMEPGLFDYLPIGWSFKEWDPEHPTSAFADFHKAMIRGIANGLNVSYTSLANDLENVNFSSIRAGLLNERDAWRRMQQMLIGHLHWRVHREWLRWALTTGALDLPSRNQEQWLSARWLPRGWPWVDPVKDLQAAAMALRLGVDSRTRIAAEQGRDFGEVLDDIAQEERLAAEKGVTLTTDLSKGGAADDDMDEEAVVGSNRLAALLGRPATNGAHHG